MPNELLIKINADAANAKKAFDDILEQTEDLQDTLKKTTVAAGIAFAAFTAEIYLSVKAFHEAEAAAIQLNTALQNQGIYTAKLAEQYKGYAEAVQASTGIDDDAITKAQAIAQTYLGQTKITEKLTFAIADLGASMGGDLNSAAEKIARTIGTGTNAFARQGLELAATATEAERFAKVLDFVNTKAGGLAAEFNKADGYTKALATAFGNLQESIGSKFAPVFSAINENLTKFFQFLADNPVISDLAAAFITAGVAVSGFVVVMGTAGLAFITLTAAAEAFGIAANIAFAGIPAAIGLVVAGLTLLALNWTQAVASVKAVTTAMVTVVTELFGGLAEIIKGAFTLDVDKIKAGAERVSGAYVKAKEDAVATYKEITEAAKEADVQQDEGKRKAAAKEEAEKRRRQAVLVAIEKGTIALIKLENENASQAQIDLKQKELGVLNALNADKTAAEIRALTEKRAIILALEDQQRAEDVQRVLEFQQIKNDTQAELESQGISVSNDLKAAQLAQLQANAQTEADIDRQVQTEILTRRTAARNQELIDRKKYGEAVAVISKALGSEEVRGAKTASDELVQLTQSKNETLKSIGKVAAVAQITIGTAESAMNIYRGFSTIPIVGPALGVAGAAAAVAFGAERIGQVTAAADGGLITGGVAGKDSVPALLMPGELVVPKKNFNDVVGAVQNTNESSGSPEMLDVLRSIDNKFSNPQQTVIQGDVMADDSYIDRLVRAISDAVQYRNAKIFGVT